tara:strand:+ start:135 stop:764 length:630 start_codon:yes stop_codon:yes gene_type:complete
MQLNEKYRPKQFSEVIGQSKAIEMLESLPSLSGRGYWIAGKSGTGKTTLARIIADKVSNPMYTLEIAADDLTMDTIRQWNEDQYYVPMGGAGRCYIINEAHGLRKDTMRKLLTFLEDIREYTTVIFTTTIDGQADLFEGHYDASPLLSRCKLVPMAYQGIAKPFSVHLQRIASEYSGKEVTAAACLKLINTYKGNLRAAIGDIEAGLLN